MTSAGSGVFGARRQDLFLHIRPLASILAQNIAYLKVLGEVSQRSSLIRSSLIRDLEGLSEVSPPPPSSPARAAAPPARAPSGGPCRSRGSPARPGGVDSNRAQCEWWVSTLHIRNGGRGRGNLASPITHTRYLPVYTPLPPPFQAAASSATLNPFPPTRYLPVYTRAPRWPKPHKPPVTSRVSPPGGVRHEFTRLAWRG